MVFHRLKSSLKIFRFFLYLACSTSLVSVLVDCYLQTYSFLPSGQLGKKTLGNYTAVSFNCSQTNHKYHENVPYTSRYNSNSDFSKYSLVRIEITDTIDS